MTVLKRWSPFLCFLFVVLSFSPKLPGQNAGPAPTIVFVNRVGVHVTYRVNSQNRKDLLLALNEVASHQGTGQEVHVIVDSRLPFDEMWNVGGVAGKAQLTNLRFFVFFQETGMMSEIKQIRAVRFSPAAAH